jgi:hypothetical protein
MSFGAEILFGDDNMPIPETMAQWLSEVRVEQELNKITKFAVRFEDDLCGDQPAVQGRPEIAANTMLSVMVPSGNRKVCLVRGRVTRLKSSMQLGGPGSWVEAHGESRQVEMDRTTIQANWTGDEARIVESILRSYDFEPDIANVQDKTYSETDQLNQRGTDFAFLNKVASENGVDFWISYEAAAANPITGDQEIAETAHFRISPPVPDGGTFDIREFTLSPTDDAPTLRVNVQGDLCPNVNTFTAEIDAERPNQANGEAVDVTGGDTTTASSQSDPSTQGDGPTVSALDGVTRTIAPAGPGDGDDQHRRQEAALREASWFVEGTVSTSAHMLGAVLAPHDLIAVEGAGAQYSIPYQVKAVTHVINAADHMMDAKLRSNFLGEAA